MADLQVLADGVAAEARFSGVVRVDRDGSTVLATAYGHADRAWGIANTLDTRFGTASGTKSWTALTVLRLVEEGVLALDAPVRRWLREDLPLVDDAVTVEHLLCHRSGIGDYLDESQDLDLNDHLLTVPVHTLGSVEAYRSVLDGFPMRSAPGERFAYNNGGYVVLSLVAERAGGAPFADLVERHVSARAGLRATAFERGDALPGGVARGYLDAEGLRSNVLHLPVLGSGDGGLITSVADIHALWAALFAGRIVGGDLVTEVVRRRDGGPPDEEGYGLGVWVPAAPGTVALEGADAGVSLRSVHRHQDRTTMTVVSNTTEGAWPLLRALEPAVFG